MNLTALLLATLIVVANATTDDGSEVRVPQAVTASSDTNKPGLVSVVATAISAATPNLRGPDSFTAVSDGHTMKHGQEEQLDKDEDQEDIAVMGGKTYRTYRFDIFGQSVSMKGTKCGLTASFQFANKKYSISKEGLTLAYSEFVFGHFEAQDSDGVFEYVDLEIDCNDALYIDYAELWVPSSMKKFGDENTLGDMKEFGDDNDWGWCLSTDPADTARVARLDWNIMFGCTKVLRFEYKTLNVFVPSSCDENGTPDSQGNCCTSSNKCGDGEGDCDSNDDCQNGLQCGDGTTGHDNNCKTDFDWGHEDHDCCYDPNPNSKSCANKDFDPAKCVGCGANADDIASCCTSSNKCGIGEGDCDKDADCMSGLKCGEGTPGHDNNCLPDFGWGARSDCCYVP